MIMIIKFISISVSLVLWSASLTKLLIFGILISKVVNEKLEKLFSNSVILVLQLFF